MESFYLERFEDVHGQSGTGVVAEGVLFSDGSAVLRWLVEPCSTVVREARDGRNGMQQFQAIHGHGGKTQLRLGKPPRWKGEGRGNSRSVKHRRVQ